MKRRAIKEPVRGPLAGMLGLAVRDALGRLLVKEH